MAEKVTIGNCELWHGDCREILPTLPGCDLILTDPPYGIGADRTRNSQKDGWIDYGVEGWDSERDTSADTPRPILDNSQREAVKAAVRWAVRGATMNGTEPDFDPDALVLNAAYALCGPCGLVTPNATVDEALPK